jgi:CheY-like chemotaxis protein
VLAEAEAKSADPRASEGWLAFEVEDTGIGIAPDKLVYIFEAFHQADGTTSRKYGGTGLGLSISRELTRLLGGELRAHSEPGTGSTFTLYLPVAQRPVPTLESADSGDWQEALLETDFTSRSGPRFHGEKILVVDDDPRTVFALTTLLQAHRLDVVYAESGAAGMRVLQEDGDVALVLMDVMMPDLDGNATVAEIRRIPAYRDLPIIVVTAKAMKGDREMSLSSGATDHVTKPVDVDYLLQLIALHLEPPEDDAEENAEKDAEDALKDAPEPGPGREGPGSEST